MKNKSLTNLDLYKLCLNSSKVQKERLTTSKNGIIYIPMSWFQIYINSPFYSYLKQAILYPAVVSMLGINYTIFQECRVKRKFSHLRKLILKGIKTSIKKIEYRIRNDLGFAELFHWYSDDVIILKNI